MEESPILRSGKHPDVVSTPDPFNEDIPERFQEKHVVYVINEHGGGDRVPAILSQIIADELSRFGIDHEVSSRHSRSKARKSPRGGKYDPNHSNGINRTVEVELRSSGAVVSVPFIVRETCNFIRKHLSEEGILRKSGSSSRAACIMQRFLSPENEEYFSTFDTVHDVANVLKQYLRQLQVPLIPQSVQNVFLQCLELAIEENRIQAILLASCLIPHQTVGVLSYVMEFLADVAQSSSNNKMTCENLAIVMGPNIMPVDPRKNDKVKDHLQQSERHILDLHNKVVEILIKNANSVGQVSVAVEKRLESYTALRSSEDELENEGVGRRKKRRSGSLNRMLGFLQKLTSGKGGETPIVPSTPMGDSFSHTPIIKGSNRKKNTDDNMFSLHKKKKLLDGVRKNGFHFNKDDARTEAGTPNAFQSPAICLNPSPMKLDWKQTPNGNRLKNFVTPSLLRRRDKGTDATDKNVFSAPAKSSKPRLKFGSKKGSKKQEIENHHDLPSSLQKGSQATSSSISIHKLANSPRATLQRNPSSRIPRPDKPAVPPRRNASASKLPEATGGFKTPDSDINCSGDGDYVTISANAEVNDVKNEAFIASSVSLTDSEFEPPTRRRGPRRTNTESSLMSTTDDSMQDTGAFVMTDDSMSTLDFPNKLQLTPLIKEIDCLTKTAQEMTLSTLRGKSASSLRSVKSRTLPESPTELDVTPLNVELVENKFIRTMKETKIMQIQSENTPTKPNNPIHRRLSVQERRMSPSQRRIMSSARRKSHEIGRVTPVVNTTRFMSLRSPKNPHLIVSSAHPCSTLRRSPTRCTLRRGRPNTTRVGLARPSPVRNTNTPRGGGANRSHIIESKKEAQHHQQEENLVQTPLRRMSSVQELVMKLEKSRREKKPFFSQDCLDESRLENSDFTSSSVPNVVISESSESFHQIQTRSKSKSKQNALDAAVVLLSEDKLNNETTPVRDQNEEAWVAAHKFSFDRKDHFRGLRGNADRDSIHFLKTLHAGKVPATVEYFNKIGKHAKSPGRSLIPRYTALHQTDGSQSTKMTPESQKSSNNSRVTSTERISRRLSSVDIRQKHEKLLENIKQERSVKRSATTAGSYQSNRRQLHENNNRRALNNNKLPYTTVSATAAKRPNTLNIKTASPSPARPSTRGSFRRTPQKPQTPKIMEEDESLTESVQKAIDNLLGSNTNKNNSKSTTRLRKQSPLASSPLKSSNIANVRREPSMRNKKFETKTVKHYSPSSPTARELKSMTRTVSERGTKATSTTPCATPKIKKALTTRAYDMMASSGYQVPNNQAHKCQTITPRRRLPRVPPTNSENRNTPLKATHTYTPVH